MRNLTLYGLLSQFTTDAGARLKLAASTDEIPFEVVDSGGRIPLYCYRPLTADFIRARLGLLTALPSYAPVARALDGVGGTDAYLRTRVSGELPEDQRGRTELVLHGFLARVFEERSEFGVDPARFEAAYAELERLIYEGRQVTEVVAPLRGIDFDPETEEVALGDGLSIVRPRALAALPPALDAVAPSQAPVLLVLRVAHDRADAPSPGFIRARFARTLTALRLYEKGLYALPGVGYARVDDGPWSPTSLGGPAHTGLLTLVPASREDELRAFCSLIARKLVRLRDGQAGAGEVAWALTRFEHGCERADPFETLTDHLLALRALLEPEGPASGRLAQRLAVICAAPVDRARLAERTARAIALERAVIAGLASPSDEAETLIDELTEHLRAILRDVLCGHLDHDLCTLADDLLAQQVHEEIAA